MKQIIASAPARVDLSGGTLDLPPLYLFHPNSQTINCGISLRCEVKINQSDKFIIKSLDQSTEVVWDSNQDIDWHQSPALELIIRIVKSFEPKINLEISVCSNVPAGSGLGGSSVLAVCVVAGLNHWFDKQFTPEQIIEYAKSIETQTIKVPTGYQDYLGAVYGKMHKYSFSLDGKIVKDQIFDQDFYKKFSDHAILVYTGKPHFSGMNNWELFKRHIDGDKKIIDFFEQLSENSRSTVEAIMSQDFTLIGSAISHDWQTRSQMIPTMTTPEIDQLQQEVMNLGAEGFRVCGAGAGGCALILCSSEKRSKIESVITDLGMKQLPFIIDTDGLIIEEKDLA